MMKKGKRTWLPQVPRGRIDHILYKFEGVPTDSMAGSIDWEAFLGLELTGPVMYGKSEGYPWL